MTKLNFLLILCSLLLSFTCHSQARIEGRLVDASLEGPIEFATIALYDSDSTLQAGTITNPDGSFTLGPLKADKYYLIAQFLGYDALTISDIQIGKNKTVDLGTMHLTPNQLMLNEIEVTGEKATTINKIDRQVFAADKFESAVGGTAIDLVQNMPAVSINSQGEISVRGSTGFVVLVNGKPLQSDPVAFLSQLPANAVENIEIVTAPSAKYDPEGKAGMINIVTKRGLTDGFYIQANARLGAPSIENYQNAKSQQRYGGDFTLNYRKGKWDISAGASYLRNDKAGRREGDVQIVRGDTLHQLPSDGERSFDDINYTGRFTVDYSPDTRNNFSFGFYGGAKTTDRLADILYFENRATDIPSGQEFYSLQYFNHNLRTRTGDFALGSLNYTHSFENESSLSTSLLYEYTLLGGPTINQNLGWPDTNVVLQDEYNTNNNPLNGIRYQLDYKFKPLSIGQFETGYQFRNLDHRGDFVYERKNNETGLFELVPDFSSEVNLKRQIHSGYVQLSGKRGKLDYGVGLRMEFMDREMELRDKANTIDTLYLYDFVKPFPSLNIQYSKSEEFRIKAAYSRRVERTTTFKMNPFPEREHSETLEQGDPTLLPEFVDLVEAGIVKDFGENSLSLTGYFRNTQNLINRVNTVYNDSILNRIYSNVGTGQAIGFELSADLEPTSWWKIFLGGNLYQYNIDGEFDNQPVSTSNWIYSINANTTFALSKTLSMQWTLNYLSATNTAQGEDSRFYNPNLTIRKSWANERFSATLQWLNMDMGLLEANEQRITTRQAGEFFTTTNYVYEVDIIMLSLSYTFNRAGKKGRFIKSEFGEKEF